MKKSFTVPAIIFVIIILGFYYPEYIKLFHESPAMQILIISYYLFWAISLFLKTKKQHESDAFDGRGAV